MSTQITRLLSSGGRRTFERSLHTARTSSRTTGAALYGGCSSSAIIATTNSNVVDLVLGSSNKQGIYCHQNQALSSYTSAQSSNSSIDLDSYVSPLQAYFDRSARGITAMGTTKFRPAPNVKLDCGISESDLRFKTASYGRTQQSPYVQPQEHTVYVKVPWATIPLDDVEKKILSDIVGSRYNKQKQMLQLKSDHFGSRIENKRHLVSMLNRLVFSARRLAKQMQDETQAVNDAE